MKDLDLIYASVRWSRVEQFGRERKRERQGELDWERGIKGYFFILGDLDCSYGGFGDATFSTLDLREKKGE